MNVDECKHEHWSPFLSAPGYYCLECGLRRIPDMKMKSYVSVPNFILNDEDRYYLSLSFDATHDKSKPVPGQHEWHLKRFGWSPWGDKD